MKKSRKLCTAVPAVQAEVRPAGNRPLEGVLGRQARSAGWCVAAAADHWHYGAAVAMTTE